MFNHLSTRFALGFVALIATVFVLLGLYLVDYVRGFEELRLRDRMAAEARLVGELARPVLADDGAGAVALADNLSADIGSRVTIIGVDGTVYGDSDADPNTMENHADRPEVIAALRDGVGSSKRQSATLNRDILYVAVPIRNAGETLGVARVALPVELENSLTADVVTAMILALAVAALISAIVSTLMARAFTKPLAELVTVTRRVSEGDLSARADTNAGAEYAALAESFNEMAEELQATIHAIDLERSRLAMLVEHLTDGIVIVDAAGRVGLINQAAERLLAVPRDRAIMHAFAEVLRDYELVALVQEARAAPPASPTTPSRLVELGRPPRSVQAFAFLIPTDQASVVLVVLRDITEFRRTEAVRRDFVANVSHDLRTPIASLKALTETLMDGALEDEAVAREFLGHMEVEVDDLAKLVEELLELSRAEAGQLELHRFQQDLGMLARRVVARLQAQALLKDITIELDLPAEPVVVDFDPDRIEQVFVNLLHNAVKFTPAGGRVTVGVATDQTWATVWVRDTGPGLETGDLERVFERFYKADRSRTATGSGLGLAIAKHLIQLHGGRIWAESDYGHGATFKFRLPRNAASEPSSSAR